MANWNPWHGCHKISAGCQNCYVYRSDGAHSKDASIVTRNSCFYDPIKKNRRGGYKIPSGETVFTCFTSDFLLDDADIWRTEAWDMIRERSDLHFFFITKRIHRFAQCVPPDWGDGWDNVTVCCTTENQQMADFRLPIFAQAKIKHKHIVCEPLLSGIDLEEYLTPDILSVSVGGESGSEARVCCYEWVLDIREQCIRANMPFTFRQTGAHFEKDGRYYNIPRKLQHIQAKKAGINTLEQQ